MPHSEGHAPTEHIERTSVSSIRFEQLDDAFGIGTATPRLSWQVHTTDPDWNQTAYEIELDGTTTVRVESSEQVLVPWPFEPLPSRRRASVRARAASGTTWSPWSEPSVVETGLLHPEDWTARFVSPRTIGGLDDPAPILSRTLTIDSRVRSARLYITAHGVYSATINGERVGDEVLAPGWTSYQHRLRYQTYDVTRHLREGENHLDMLLGNGWYRGAIARSADRLKPGSSGQRLAVLAQLEIAYDDGSTELIGTDGQWRATDSGILANDLYHGQRTDLGITESRAVTVEVIDGDFGRLVAPEFPPTRVTEVLPAVAVWTSPSGKQLIDFGQNVVGWVRLRVRGGPPGAEVTVRHAEVLDDGELCVRTLRSAKATDSYLLAGVDEEWLEPSLTFHGFRYAEVTGVAGLRGIDVQAVVIGTDLRQTGWFSCSNQDLEQLHANVIRSAKGNFLSVPTDCPQRDERLGWTGDIQVFAPAACFLFDVGGFLSSWLRDLAMEQYPDGTVPSIVPDLTVGLSPPIAGWSDAATIVPWVLYQRYGDEDVLRRQFDSMRRWVDKVSTLTRDGIWADGVQNGDWLDPTAPPDNPAAAKADPGVVATAYFVRSTDIVAESARILGYHAEADTYAQLAARTREAFAREYVTTSGRVVSDAQTVYALALEWALVPSAEQRRTAALRLGDLVRTNGFRIATGFLGTPLIADALTSTGQSDVAYRLVLEKSCPSWLYPVAMGATSVWERWDCIRPDGSINPGTMVSFNHYALGAVADWLHRTVAGLAPATAGYREITVRPIPHHSLTRASARHETPYGEAAVAWTRRNGTFTMTLTVPVGATATVHLPGMSPETVQHGVHSWTIQDPCLATHEITTIRDLYDSPLWPDAVRLLTDHEPLEPAQAIAKKATANLDHDASELVTTLLHFTNPDHAHNAQQALKSLIAEAATSRT